MEFGKWAVPVLEKGIREDVSPFRRATSNRLLGSDYFFVRLVNYHDLGDKLMLYETEN